MDDLGGSDAAAFVAEEIEPLVVKVLDAQLGEGRMYSEAEVDSWVNFICEDVMAALAELKKPFKYVVNVVVQQATGAGMHTALSEYCDGENDGVCVVKWPTEKTKDPGNMLAVCTIFGVAI